MADDTYETPEDDPAEGAVEMGDDLDPTEGQPGPDTNMGLTLGGGVPSDEDDEAIKRPAPMVRGKMDRFGVAMGTGRRKTGVARVRIKDGNGQFMVNGRKFEDYVVRERDRLMILALLKVTEMEGKVDISVNVVGGGLTGQTGAIILGIARALQVKNPALHPRLSEGGYLTRDSRMVERKHYGHKKARRSFQFSKR